MKEFYNHHSETIASVVLRREHREPGPAGGRPYEWTVAGLAAPSTRGGDGSVSAGFRSWWDKKTGFLIVERDFCSAADYDLSDAANGLAPVPQCDDPVVEYQPDRSRAMARAVHLCDAWVAKVNAWCVERIAATANEVAAALRERST